MRKVITVIFILLFVAVATFFIVDRVNAEEDLTIMRVKLSIGDPITHDIKAIGSYYVEEDPSIEQDGYQKYRVSLSGSNDVSLYKLEENGNYTLLTTKRHITFIERESENYNISTISMYNDRYNGMLGYRGDILFYKDTGAYHLHAINSVNIEYYLMGVIGYEMSNSWPMEALKTQAVAARSYAVKHIGARTYYDVVDTSGSQVYKGWNQSLDRCINAVNLTRGQVVAYISEENRNDPDYQLQKRDIVTTFFSASNGGQIDIPQHVWNEGGSPMPWQVITNDPYDLSNPSSREEVVYFPAQVNNEYEYPANGLKQIKDLAIPLLQEEGFIATTRDDFKVLGITDMFTLKGQVTKTSSGTVIEDHTKLFPGDHVLCIDRWVAFTTVDILGNKIIDGVLVQDQANIQVRIDLNECDDQSSPYKIFSQTSLRVTVSEPVMDGDTVVGYNLIQRRFGHGLGMSQRGAQTMAKEGFTYDEILLFYFPNTELRNLDNSTGANPTPTGTTGPTPSLTYNATVQCNTYLNVRSGPGTSYIVVGQVTNNQRLVVIEPFAAPQWHKINYNEAHAYVHKDYVVLDPDSTPAPTPAPTSTGGLPVPSLRPGGTVTPSPTPVTTPQPTPTPSSSPDPGPTEGALSYDALGKVTASVLNVRSGPATSYDVAGMINRDDVVIIKQVYSTTSWHSIYYQGKVKYVYAAYINITDNTNGYCYYENGKYTFESSTPTEPPTDTMYGTVTATSLNIRSGPSTDYARIGSIPRGGTIEITDYGTSWSKIKYGGISGYVSSQYFTVTSGTSSGTPDTDDQIASVMASSLRIRSGPGTSYRQIGVIPYGDVVIVLNYDTSWTKVNYNGLVGYCYSSYLKLR